MIKSFKNKKLASALVLIMVVATVMMAPITTYAVAFTQPSTVNGDGVRLRKAPVSGTILELMYKGEAILISDVIDNNHPAWLYIKRVKTSTKGWMEWAYFDHDTF